MSDIKFKIKSITGQEVAFNLMPISQEDSMEVMHESLITVFELVAGAADTGGLTGIASALRKIKIKDLWAIGLKIFDQCLIDNVEMKTESQLRKTFAMLPPDIFYRAITDGVKNNWPDFFGCMVKEVKKNLHRSGLKTTPSNKDSEPEG